MSHERRQLAEKFQVLAAAAGALAVSYYLLAPLAATPAAEGALTFAPAGGAGPLAVFAVSLWAIAAACAVLTISARAEGALLAALTGAAGFSLRSGAMRVLLWAHPSPPERVFVLLSAEALILTGVVVVAALIIAVVRASLSGLLPRWAWTDPVSGPSARQAASRQQTPETETQHGVIGVIFRRLQAYGDTVKPAALAPLAGGVLMELAIAMVLLVLTFRSTDRGQVQFAIGASFLLAALAAHQTFPVRWSLPFYLLPPLVGAAVLVGGGGEILSQAGPAWRHALDVAEGLPLRAAFPADWLAFGCGGAVAGIWFSRRLCEARHLENRAAEKSGKPAGAARPGRSGA